MNATTPVFEKVFSREDFASHVHDVKLRMERAGYDLIICQDPSNMCWLTGYDGWSFYVPQCVLMHLQEDSPFWFERAQDAKAACVTTYLPDEKIIPYSESLVQHPVDHPYDELVELIKAACVAAMRAFNAPYSMLLLEIGNTCTTQLLKTREKYSCLQNSAVAAPPRQRPFQSQRKEFETS